MYGGPHPANRESLLAACAISAMHETPEPRSPTVIIFGSLLRNLGMRTIAMAGLAIASGPVFGLPTVAESQTLPAHCLTSNLRKPCVVPESLVRTLTPEQQAQAIEYARLNGIRWRIARGK
jgi:hypothetical protein